MRILALNTWHNNEPCLQRRDALLQGIAQYAPDILLLQELFDADWSNELQARLGYPYLVSTECIHSGLVVLSKLAAQRSEIYRMKTKSPFETYWRYALCAEVASVGYRLSVFKTHLSWEFQDDATRQAQVMSCVHSSRSSAPTAALPLLPEILLHSRLASHHLVD